MFLVVTANQIDRLPAESLRKGRFDGIFVVDRPDASTREQLFTLRPGKRKLNSSTFDLQ